MAAAGAAVYRLCERLYLQVQPLCRIVSAFGFGPLFFGFRHDVPDLFQRERCRVGIFRDAVVFAAGCDVGTVTAVQYLYLRFGIEDLDGLFRCLAALSFSWISSMARSSVTEYGSSFLGSEVTLPS